MSETSKKHRPIGGLDQSVILPDNQRKRKRAQTEVSEDPKEDLYLEQESNDENLANQSAFDFIESVAGLTDLDDEGIERYTADVFMKLPSKKQYPDYYEIIKKPISFEEIKSKAKTKSYTSITDVKSDFDLVFNNAKRYNQSGSNIYRFATRLHKLARNFSGFTARSSLQPLAQKDLKKDFKALAAKVVNYIKTLTDETEEGTRYLYEVFWKVPDRKQYASYYQIIKKPTSLENVIAKANKGEISSVEQLRAEFELIWTNAQTFNTDESIIFQDSLRLQELTSSYISTLTGTEAVSPKIEVDDDDEDVFESDDDEDGKPITKKRRKNINPKESGEKKLVFKTWLTEKTQELMDHQDETGRSYSEHFMDLPDKAEYPEYYQIIKKPVCFAMVLERITKRYYHVPENWYKDIDLMIANALSYNEDESRIWRDTKMLQTKWNDIKAAGYPPFPFLQRRAEREAEREKEAQEKAKLEQEAQEKARQELEQRLIAEAALQQLRRPSPSMSIHSPSPTLPSQAYTPDYSISKASSPGLMDYSMDGTPRHEDIAPVTRGYAQPVPSNYPPRHPSTSQPKTATSANSYSSYQQPLRQETNQNMTNHQMIQNYLNGAERTRNSSFGQQSGHQIQTGRPVQNGAQGKISNTTYPSPSPKPLPRAFCKMPTEMEPSLIEEFRITTDTGEVSPPKVVFQNSKRLHFPIADRPSEHTRSALRSAEKPQTSPPDLDIVLTSRPLIETTEIPMPKETDDQESWKRRCRQFVIRPRVGLTVLEFKVQKVGSKGEGELLRLYFTRMKQ